MKDKYMVWLMYAVLALMACIACCACKATKEFEVVEVHDTVTVLKTDTVVDVKVKEVSNTEKQTETHYYTLNNVGDTVKEIHHYHNALQTIVLDSTNRYQSKVDSLQRLVSTLKNTEKVVTKRISVPWWAWVACPLIFIIGLGIIAKRVLRDKWHMT